MRKELTSVGRCNRGEIVQIPIRNRRPVRDFYIYSVDETTQVGNVAVRGAIDGERGSFSLGGGTKVVKTGETFDADYDPMEPSDIEKLFFRY